MNASKLISIIIPVYNEQENIPLIYGSLIETWQNIDKDLNYEIIFINDGSKDKSDEIIHKLTALSNRIKYIEFSRNFGKEMATSAGLHCAQGDAAIIIDADLQHPPELIPEFISKWQNGADIVIGVKENSQQQSLFRKIGSFFFNKTMNLISEIEFIPKATDFRLIDKKLIQEFSNFSERNRITRGLLDWLGFKKNYVYFNANSRQRGQAKYSKAKLIKLAMSSYVTHSLFPLKIAGYLGIFITIISGLLGLFIFITKLFFNDVLGFSGTAMLATLILFLIGIVLGCLGLIALYIASIHSETINRPMYVIKKKKNLD